MSYFVRYPEPSCEDTRQEMINLADTSKRIAERMMNSDNAAINPYHNFRERRLTEARIAGESIRSCSDVYTYKIKSALPELCDPLFDKRQVSAWDSSIKRNVTSLNTKNAPCIRSRPL